MTALLDQLLAQAAPTQHAAVQQLRTGGLPGARDERWKYSSLRALNQRSFAAAPARHAVVGDVLRARIEALPARIVLVDGWYAPSLSDISRIAPHLQCSALDAAAIPAPPHLPFALAATAAAQSRLRVDVSAGAAIEQTLHLVSVITAAATDTVVQQTIALRLGDGARLRVARHRLHEDAASTVFANEWRTFDIGARAQLTWIEHGKDGERSSAVTGCSATLGSDARLDFAEVAAGAGLYRHDLDVALDGERAELLVRGCAALGGRRHADVAIDVRHRARNTRADIVWRGLADQRGHAVFGGRLIIESGADGSDTALSNKNLLLSAHAEIDTRPVLEIYADEVKAAHGATVGRLDERSLFYLRSRGLPEAEARRMLTLAFAREPLMQVADEALRDTLLAALARSLPKLDA